MTTSTLNRTVAQTTKPADLSQDRSKASQTTHRPFPKQDADWLFEARLRWFLALSRVA